MSDARLLDDAKDSCIMYHYYDEMTTCYYHDHNNANR